MAEYQSICGSVGTSNYCKSQMSNTRKHFRALGITLICLVGNLSYAGLNEGMDAYTRQDWQGAYREFRPLADSNDPIAQYFLGSMYFNGWGVPRNDRETVRLFKASAEAGVAMSQFLYGILHMSGQRGIVKNEAIGVKWIRLAANQGILEAMDHVGTFYRKGTVYDVNLVEACVWYETAALLGYSISSGKCARIARENNFTNTQVDTILEMAKGRAKNIKANK